MGAILFARIGQDGLGRFEIGVQIAKNGKAHSGEC
jgi:hypothetical protein